MKVTTTMTHSSSIIIIANVPPRQMTTNQQQPTNWNVSTLHARAGIPRNRDMLLRSWSAAISRIKAALEQFRQWPVTWSVWLSLRVAGVVAHTSG